MKRIVATACIATTLLVIAIVVFRGVTAKDSGRGVTAETAARMDGMVTEFVDVQTEPVSQEAFEAAIRSRSGPGIEGLTALERERLFDRIGRFYQCYSSGDFGAYAKFRLFAPATVRPALRSFVQEMGHNLKELSEEEILRIAWVKLNSTNRITSCELESISLRVEEREDLGMSIRYSSTALRDGVFPGATTWNRSVEYEPTPENLLAKETTLRLFRLELNVRMNDLQVGPATPIVVTGYWDSTKQDWMPLSYSTAFLVGDYYTIF